MIRGLLYFSTGAMISLAAGWLAFPRVLYQQKPQPFQFNHLAHTGEKGGMACTDCHSFREDATFTGIPRLESCAACHAEPVGQSETEKHFVEEYVKKEREPQWRVYARQPDNAWFPHAAHVLKAKLACERCHLDHGKSQKLPVYEENRITGYSRFVMGDLEKTFVPAAGHGLRMDDCIACHRQSKLEHSCLDCHK